MTVEDSILDTGFDFSYTTSALLLSSPWNLKIRREGPREAEKFPTKNDVTNTSQLARDTSNAMTSLSWFDEDLALARFFGRGPFTI